MQTAIALLKEFKILGAPATVKAGPVTFQATVKANNAVVGMPVAKLLNIAPGKTSAALTVKLAPGKYILLCNVAGHYQAGQYAAIVVR